MPRLPPDPDSPVRRDPHSVSTLPPDPEVLLAGPRGRHLCLGLLEDTLEWCPASRRWSPQPDELAAQISEGIASRDVGQLAAALHPELFLAALADTVTSAMYWQEAAEPDWTLQDPGPAAALAPIARAVCGAPAAAWWATPIELAGQFHVVFDDPLHPGREWRPEPADQALAEARGRELKFEQRMKREAARAPENLTAAWWSTPTSDGLLTSTRALTHGPVGLDLVEDSSGPEAATCRPLQPPMEARVFEIHGPEDWSDLVARYPVKVTHSRRHDWRRATGEDHSWAIPDYAAVAADYDGIHLSVIGYLATAGRALPAGDAHTVLAGWDPDTTWWLTDHVAVTEEPIRWELTDQLPGSWRPINPAG